jgi:hypothetical protein
VTASATMFYCRAGPIWIGSTLIAAIVGLILAPRDD